MKHIAFLDHTFHFYYRMRTKIALMFTGLLMLSTLVACPLSGAITKSVADVINEVEKTRQAIDTISDDWRDELSKLQVTIKGLESQVNADVKGLVADTANQVHNLSTSAIELADAKAQNLIAQAGVEFRCNSRFVKRGVLDQLQFIIDDLKFWQANKSRLDRKPDHAVCWINPSALSLYLSGNNWLIDTGNMSERGIVFVYGYNFRPDALPTLELQNADGQLLRVINVRPAYVTHYQINLDFANETFPDVTPGGRVVFNWPDVSDPNTINLTLQAPGKLEFSNPVFNLQSPIAQKDLVALKVTVANIGGSPVQAFTVVWQPDPNDTKVFPVSSPTALQPGESRDFNLGSYVYQRSGDIQGTLTLSTGDPILQPSISVLAPEIPPVVQCPEPRWGLSISEENGFGHCPSGFAVRGIRCTGRYCDNMILYCEAYQPDADDSLGNAEWGEWFSDESGYMNYWEGRFVIGLACTGDHCDNVRLSYHSSPNLININQCYSTPWFSEEQGEQYCAEGEFVAGMQCSGDDCDRIVLNCCRSSDRCE